MSTTRQSYFFGHDEVELRELPVGPLSAGAIRVKPHALAFNPTDYKHLLGHIAENTVVGCDLAGEVIEIGEGVTDVKVGDTVAGSLPGGNQEAPNDGAFSTIVDLPSASWVKIDGLVDDKSDFIPAGPVKSFEQASTVGIPFGTAALAFIHYNNTPIVKNSKSGYALIYGVSSALGHATAQVAKYLGYTVIAVAAKKHADLIKQIGVEHHVDQNDADWVEQVKKIGGEDVIYAFDTISESETFAKVAEAVSSTKPVKINLSLPGTKVPASVEAKKNITFDFPLYYFAWQKRKWYGVWLEGDEKIEAKRPDYTEAARVLVADNHAIVLPVEVVATGFDKVPEFYARYKQGVSGRKLVLRL